MFPIFVHSYLDLVIRGHTEKGAVKSCVHSSVLHRSHSIALFSFALFHFKVLNNAMNATSKLK